MVEIAWKKGGSLAGLPECEFLPEIPRPKNRYRLVYRGGQLVCEFAGPSFYEDRDWRNEVRRLSFLSDFNGTERAPSWSLGSPGKSTVRSWGFRR